MVGSPLQMLWAGTMSQATVLIPNYFSFYLDFFLYSFHKQAS